MALDGRFRPVVEFMYPDFLWVAADQVFNQIGKARHMFGGNGAVPLVLRTKVAAGTGYGSQHSMDPAGIFATQPGWRIVAPSTPLRLHRADERALAIDDPVLVLEHVDLYGTTGDDSGGRPRLPAALRQRGGPPRGQRRHGADLPDDGPALLDAVEEPGSTPRSSTCAGSTGPRSTGTRSARASSKTNSVLIVEQGAIGTSYGGWLSDEIQRRFFDWLDQPVERVTGRSRVPDASPRCSNGPPSPGTEEIVDGLRRISKGLGSPRVEH